MADIYAEVKVYSPTAEPHPYGYTHSGVQVRVDNDGSYPIRIGLLCYSPAPASGHVGGYAFEIWKKVDDTSPDIVRIHGSALTGTGPWTIRATDNGTSIVWSVGGVDKFTDTGQNIVSSPYYYPKIHALTSGAGYANNLDFDDFTWSDGNEPGPAWTDAFGSDSGKWVSAGGAYVTWTIANGRKRAALTGGADICWGNLETRFRAPAAPATLYVDSTDAQSGTTNPSGIDLTPVFSAVYDSADGDPGAGYYIQVTTDSDFGALTHWDSGWTNQTTADGARCANIAHAGSALSNGTTYYWRVKFKDDHGGYGSAWSAAGTFFTTVEAAVGALQVPDTLYSHSTTAQSGSHNPNGVDLTPVFSAINRLGATATRYNLGVYSDMGYQTPLWLSGWTNFVAQPADDARCENIAYAGDTLANCTQYWWRIQMGTAGDTSPWSGEYAFFRDNLPSLDRMESRAHGS